MSTTIAHGRGRRFRLAATAIVALLLVVALPGVALGHHATATCEHITIGGVPAGVSGELTPGPIEIVPPNAQTSINGTYAVPPGTYTLTFSDHARPITDLVVTVCPSGSAEATASAASSTSTNPTPTPIPTPTATTTTGSAPPSGQVEGATGTPTTITLPPTATLDGSGGGGAGSGLPIVLVVLFAVVLGISLLGPASGRARRPGRRK